MTHQPFCRSLLAAGLLAVAALAPLPAAAYSSLVIFGDSLSDSGNNASLLGTAPGQVITGNSYIPTRPYASGTYSNSDVWATSFAAALGLQALPSRGGGSNYAYGGAITNGGFPPSLTRQLQLYGATAPTDEASALYVIAGGGNNARAALSAIDKGADATTTIAAVAAGFASDIGNMVDTLQAAGAQKIVVWNTPDIGLAPAVLAQNDSAMGTRIASAMNLALDARLLGEQGVVEFNIFNLVGEASSFGLVNVTDACGAIALCNPDTYLFWDGIHPTSAGHALISSAMLATVVPEPATLWMFALGGAALLLRRRRRQPPASAGAANKRSMSSSVV